MGRDLKDEVLVLPLLLLLVPAAAPAGAQTAGGWKVVGQIGGQTRGLAVRDGRAYAGIGMRLVILDASTPSAHTTGFLRGPNVTATATDRHGRTSGFSRPLQLPPSPPRRRPVRR